MMRRDLFDDERHLLDTEIYYFFCAYWLINKQRNKQRYIKTDFCVVYKMVYLTTLSVAQITRIKRGMIQWSVSRLMNWEECGIM
jgi:hypothetical protein